MMADDTDLPQERLGRGAEFWFSGFTCEFLYMYTCAFVESQCVSFAVAPLTQCLFNKKSKYGRCRFFCLSYNKVRPIFFHAFSTSFFFFISLLSCVTDFDEVACGES